MTQRGLTCLLALAIMVASLVAAAQHPGKVARMGVLCLIACDASGLEAFRLALQDLGYGMP
jgi:hypothetical protein